MTEKTENTGIEKSKTQEPDKSKNPGAARFGNFINYYEFNPPENRLKFLPSNLSSMLGAVTPPLAVLDVGCNAGVSYNSLY